MANDRIVVRGAREHNRAPDRGPLPDHQAVLTVDGSNVGVLEPGGAGSFMAAKERFGAGSGDERPALEAAVRAMRSLDSWTMAETYRFFTQFQFDDADDFCAAMLPGFRERPPEFRDEVLAFLGQHVTPNGIVLDAERQLTVLRRAERGTP